jgi:hypothetical protein
LAIGFRKWAVVVGFDMTHEVGEAKVLTPKPHMCDFPLAQESRYYWQYLTPQVRRIAQYGCRYEVIDNQALTLDGFQNIRCFSKILKIDYVSSYNNLLFHLSVPT